MAIIIVFIFIIIFPLVLGLLTGAVADSQAPGIIFGIFIDLIILVKSIVIVKQKTVQLVEFLGRFNRILHPGLNFIIPFLERTRIQFLFKTNKKVIVEGLTKDNVSTKIQLNVVYFVKNDEKDMVLSVYEIDNPETLIQATIDEQLRSMITEFDHKEIFTKRNEIGEAIESNLREKLRQFGYTLDSIQVQDILLDGNVLSALNKIVETEKLKIAAMNEAEAKKIRLVKEAEADKEAKKLIGQGMAEQRKAIADGFKESVEMIKASDKELGGEEVLQFLLDSARIETLEKVANGNSKIIYLNENLEGKGRVEKLLSK